VQDIPPDLTGETELLVEERHTAAALGNTGMAVLGTPFVLLIIEQAAALAVWPYLAEGEGVAGTHIDLRHLAPTGVGRRAQARVRLRERAGRRLRFSCVVTSGGQVVAEGLYESAVVDMARILATAQAQPPD
jgi:fluoroacetyl-CoA thioesterase